MQTVPENANMIDVIFSGFKASIPQSSTHLAVWIHCTCVPICLISGFYIPS